MPRPRIADINAEASDRYSISLLRATKILNLFAREILSFVRGATERTSLRKKISIALGELFDPNHRKRETTLGRIHSELAIS